ncbi:RICIN domain-containing protein [Nonomuraea sp. SBT364]|uniref:RICIN domain-containing protein n=1 Tax=Nonomuraea sp. SBT364 TaxID=1580530 RepID=UPI00066D39F7|nr:RICIN domain-containing protein [Nonomuraea sp. SBT364]
MAETTRSFTRGAGAIAGALLAVSAVTPPAAVAAAAAAVALPQPGSDDRGDFYSIVAEHSDLAITAQTHGPRPLGMVQAPMGGRTTQQWRVVRWGHAWVLVNRHSGLCAAIPREPHARLVQDVCGRYGRVNPRALWHADRPGVLSGRPVMWRSAFNKECIDVFGRSHDHYTIVQHHRCHRDENQVFRLVPVTGS